MGSGAFGEGEGAGDVGAEASLVDEPGYGAHSGLVVLDEQGDRPDLGLLRRGLGVLVTRQEGDQNSAGRSTLTERVAVSPPRESRTTS